MPQKPKRAGAIANYQPDSSTSGEIVEEDIQTSTTSEEEDESDTDSEPECLKAVDKYLAGEIDSSEFSHAMSSSSDETAIKEEYSELDEQITVDSSLAPEATTLTQDQPTSRFGRSRQPPKFYGNLIHSSIKGLIGIVTSEEANSYAIKDDESRANSSLITRAREAEIQGWRDFNVMNEVPRAEVPRGFQIIWTIWVDVWKEGEMGRRQVKSRLCVRRNEERIKIGQTFAPTVSRDVLLLSLTVMISNRWKIRSMDVEKAFLQSGSFDRKVFVRPPSESGVEPTKVWQLNVTAYGLTDAARKWYLRLEQTLLDCGFLMCQVEPAVFFMKDSRGKLKGIMVTHVDDFLYASDQQFLTAVEEMKKK